MKSNGIKSINEYDSAQMAEDKAICELLHRIIDSVMTGAESKIWHGSPVWFLNGNPIVGYHKLKDSVRLLFWSGQSFDEKDLLPEGTFKAAEIRYTASDQIDKDHITRWLEKSKKIQWDYKNIVKRRGQLERL